MRGSGGPNPFRGINKISTLLAQAGARLGEVTSRPLKGVRRQLNETGAREARKNAHSANWRDIPRNFVGHWQI
jgi:hypothetical protein